ncbi:hypothetical protein [Vibrio sp.]|uniref:hypothetical protein n=1 Tax=Vibrio sp. TaxID=678 RepID=UPI00311DC1E7
MRSFLKFSLISLILVTLSGCTGDNVSKILNQGGVLKRDTTYDFQMVQIGNINARSDSYSEASICKADSPSCWKLTYDGDLSDYENFSYVNVEILNGKITEIDSVWFTTKWAYYVALFFIGHTGALIFGKYIFLPLVIAFIFLSWLGRNAEPNEEEQNI